MKNICTSLQRRSTSNNQRMTSTFFKCSQLSKNKPTVGQQMSNGQPKLLGFQGQRSALVLYTCILLTFTHKLN